MRAREPAEPRRPRRLGQLASHVCCAGSAATTPVLSEAQHQQFVTDGLCVLRGAVPPEVCAAAVRELEEQLGVLDTNVEHQDTRIAEQEGRLGQQEEAMAAMKRQMAFLVQQMVQPRGSKQTGEKRPALAELPPRVQLPQ